MHRVRFYQRTGARGALALRKQLKEDGVNCFRIRNSNSNYYASPGDIIINWGWRIPMGSKLIGRGATILNLPENISNASNKLKCFQRLSMHEELRDKIPKFTDDISQARVWADNGILVYCRTKLSGNSGSGIVLANSGEGVVDAPLYTQAVSDIQREIRVHVFNNAVIDSAQKRRMGSERLDDEGIVPNEFIRSYNHGYIFAREGFECPSDAKDIAVKTIAALGLDFGSIDMLLTSGGPVVLEVNTASGMQGTTVTSYARAIKELISS